MVRIEELASRLVEAPSAESEQAFRAALSTTTDRQCLRALAERFFADPEVSIPTFERLLSLAPEDLEARVSLGAAFWQMGEDDEARRQLEEAQAQAPDDSQVLLLEAMLTRELAERIRVYRRVLEKDPSNETARNQLRQLAIEEPARRWVETHEPRAREDLRAALSQETDPNRLRVFLVLFQYSPEVLRPTCERILSLEPQDIEALRCLRQLGEEP